MKRAVMQRGFIPFEMIRNPVERASIVRTSQTGFTIVETMIVLAVTGALFLLASVAVSGEQNRTEFQQAINNIQSSIQQAINQVASGDYPTTNIKCDGTSGALSIGGNGNGQGTNTGCVFLGKVLQFGVQGPEPQQYVAHTIAGLQCIGGTIGGVQPPSGVACDGTLQQTDPVAVAPGQMTHTNYPNASVTSSLQYGLMVPANGMKYIDGSGISHPIGAVAFISSLNNDTGSDLLFGSQQIDMYPVTGTSLNKPPNQTVDKIDSNLATSPKDPAGGVQICFASGTTNESGLISIGSNGRTLSVTLAIKYDRTCT